MLAIGSSVVMVNRAIHDDDGVQVKVVDAEPTRVVVSTVFAALPRQYTFTKRLNGWWVQQGFPTAVGWGRALQTFGEAR